MNNFTLVSIFLLLIAAGDAARILAIFPVGCHSHKLAAVPIMEALAEAGHRVTVFSPYKPVKDRLNITEFQLDIHDFRGEMDWFAMSEESQVTQTTKMLLNFWDELVRNYRAVQNHPELRRIIKERDFDLVFTDGYSSEFLPLVDQLGKPIVQHFSTGAMIGLMNAFDGAKDYAFVPNGLTDFEDRMNFFQRMTNFLTSEISRFITLFYLTHPLDALIREDFPNYRGFIEASSDVSLLLVNSHHTSAWLRSMPPNAIPLGSVHTRRANALEEPFKSFADGADKGLIIFTLGSLVQVSKMPVKTREAFINVFARLPQRVIWKWEAPRPENVSTNVMMTKWLPQQDLLGHPNARLFIAHGGQLGIQETIFHGVPVLGLPFGNDQRTNLAKAKKEGFGMSMEWEKINEEVLYEAINRLINDPSVRGNATRISQLARDELRPAKDVAVYWIEHVLRHNGTKHLQLSSKKMPFYQRWLLDVIFFLLAVLFIVLLLIYAICYFFIAKCFKQTKKIKVN